MLKIIVIHCYLINILYTFEKSKVKRKFKKKKRMKRQEEHHPLPIKAKLSICILYGQLPLQLHIIKWNSHPQATTTIMPMLFFFFF